MIGVSDSFHFYSFFECYVINVMICSTIMSCFHVLIIMLDF